MGSNKLELNILLKRIELLEMKVKELKIMEPEVFNERMSRIEDKLFSVKEMLTTTEVAEYLGVTQSQIYKLTMNLEIPHFKPKGKLIYFDRKELLRWMRKNHVGIVKQKNDKSNITMKRKKHNKTEVYTDAQLTALLKKSEVVISSSKNDNKKELCHDKNEKQ